MKRHRTPKPTDAAIARRWSALKAKERELADWLRRIGVRFMSDGDIDVHSVVCPCSEGRHRALVAIDGRDRWVADCEHCLGVTLALSNNFLEHRK